MTTPHDRMEWLAKANETRVELAALRRHVHEGPSGESRQRLAGLLDDPPAAMRNVFLVVAVGWCYRMGRGQADALVMSHGIGLQRMVGELTARQRGLVAVALRGGEMVREAA